MRDALFRLATDDDASLQTRIRRMLVAAVAEGHLAAGDPVPSTRAMARRIGVSRNTVTLAYQALVADGLLKPRDRSGFYVELEAAGIAAPPLEPPAPGRPVDWTARFALRPTTQSNIAKPADWSTAPYPFIYGQVDASLFPIAEWRDCVRQAMGKRWLDAWTEDRFTRDDPELVRQIRKRLLPRRGILARDEEILVTLGAQNALYLIASVLVAPGTPVVVEDPGYQDLRNMLRLAGAELRPAAVDREGLTLGMHLAGARLIFATPSHHYPTTVTMGMERRRALLDEARRADALIVEDDYEFETNYSGEPFPALKSFDADGRVIHVGSLSKSLMPGLRLGYVVAAEPLIEELRAMRRLMLRHPPGNNQRAAALFLANGHFDVLAHRIHRVYRERWQAMGRALAEHFPGWSRVPSFGGSSYWLVGPKGFDAGRLAARALDEGIVIEPGAVFFSDPEANANTLRLGFSSIATERIAPGIARLAGLIEEAGGRQRPPSDPSRRASRSSVRG